MGFTLTLWQFGQLALVTIVGMKLIDLATAYFFKKLTRDDYVTKKSCEDCSSRGNGEVGKLTREISSIKGILLVIAVKSNIPAEDLRGLTQ